MSSLRQLLATHGSILVLDAASARIQVGWLHKDEPARWAASTEEAGIGVFRCIESLGVSIREAGAFIYCEGPGSILGIRTVAMALRSWQILQPQPVFAYCSLSLVAEALDRPNAGVIADARRDSWHFLRRGETLRRVATADLSGELVMPEHFRNWSPTPSGMRVVPYSVEMLLSQVSDADLFTRTEAPDAFLHEEPSYVTWIPQIHRAPSSP